VSNDTKKGAPSRWCLRPTMVYCALLSVRLFPRPLFCCFLSFSFHVSRDDLFPPLLFVAFSLALLPPKETKSPTAMESLWAAKDEPTQNTRKQPTRTRGTNAQQTRTKRVTTVQQHMASWRRWHVDTVCCCRNSMFLDLRCALGESTMPPTHCCKPAVVVALASQGAKVGAAAAAARRTPSLLREVGEQDSALRQRREREGGAAHNSFLDRMPASRNSLQDEDKNRRERTNGVQPRMWESGGEPQSPSTSSLLVLSSLFI
jgi:hypothetical protein